MLLRITAVLWQFIRVVFLDDQRCTINPVRTQQYVQLTYQLHVSTKLRRLQAGHIKDKTNAYTQQWCQHPDLRTSEAVYVFFFYFWWPG